MHKRSLVDSFNYAIEGFIYVLKSQRNMRIHFMLAVAVLLLAIYLNLEKLEIIVLCVAITLVLFAEMINTAIEYVMDMINQEYHPIARIVKDITAGAVLITAINAITIGYLIFIGTLPSLGTTFIFRIQQSPWHITFIALLLVLSLVIIGKVIFHKGTPMRGGMPSGHSAIAFSIWTITIFLNSHDVVVIFVFLMAFIIARSRIKGDVHNIWEVIAGALLGILVTTMVFQILS